MKDKLLTKKNLIIFGILLLIDIIIYSFIFIGFIKSGAFVIVK